jgi:hypothetical protein
MVNWQLQGNMEQNCILLAEAFVIRLKGLFFHTR